MRIFKSANIYAEGRGVKRCDLAFGEKILAIGDCRESGDVINVPDGCIVLPGFIDQHIHGAGGADAMDGSLSALGKIAETVAAEGTVRFLATTMTQNKPRLLAAVSAVAEYMSLNARTGAAVEGIHLEGPFLSPERAGAQSPDWIVKPDWEYFKELYVSSRERVKMITVAPEIGGAEEFIKRLVGTGVSVSVGHSNADYECLCRAGELGADCVTHLYNAQSGFHHRDIGVAGGALLSDGFYTELIADGIHVSYPAIKLTVKNKPLKKIILITDAIRAKGLPDGDSELGGNKVYVRNGEARLADGTLAGSVLKMNIAVRNMVEKAGVPLTDAVDFASANPAAHLNIADRTGSIREGKQADFTVLDSAYNVVYTIRDGNVIYRA